MEERKKKTKKTSKGEAAMQVYFVVNLEQDCSTA